LANKKDTQVASLARNFVLFETDLFVFRQGDDDIDNWSVGGDCAGWIFVRLLLADGIAKDCCPIMEDWGWTFAVSVDTVRICVNVWAFSEENCWLLGLEPENGWLWRRSSEKLVAAKEVVASALETIMAADKRFVKYGWFAINPFDLNTKDF
jgi:hypothetical protein